MFLFRKLNALTVPGAPAASIGMDLGQRGVLAPIPARRLVGGAGGSMGFPGVCGVLIEALVGMGRHHFSEAEVR